MLLVFADGPKDDPKDRRRCEEARRVMDRVDWDCEVRTSFSAVNLGCGRRLSSGFQWVFEQVEEAILIEDDCIPTESFFWFCQSLLEKYRDDERIMHVNGSNLQKGGIRTPHSYYFSRYPHSWGWASWRRAFRHYDFSMASWPEFRDSGSLARFFPNQVERRYWTRIFDRQVSGNPIDAWSYAWRFAILHRRGVAVTPAVNMVSNIGFGRPDALHTKYRQKPAPTGDIWELCHPPAILVDSAADSNTFRHATYPLRRRIRHTLMKLLGQSGR